MASATNTANERTAAVTIHRGELAQIRNLIAISTSNSPAEGELYGLWTHSFQPVVQLVVYSNVLQKPSNSSNEEFLHDNYGLRVLGKWCGIKTGYEAPGLPTFDNKRYVNVEFVLEENELRLSDSEVKRGDKRFPEKGKLEILPGQSSFRLCEEILGKLKLQASIDVTEEDRAAVRDLRREAEVKEDQWYSTENGKEILKFLCQNFPNISNMQLLEISRNTETHNIGFSLKYQRQPRMGIRLEFPANFPEYALTLLCDDQEIQVEVSTEDSNQKPEEFAQFICGLVMSTLDEHVNFVTERAKKERKQKMKEKSAQGDGQDNFEMKNDNKEEEMKVKDDGRPQGGNVENIQGTDVKFKNLNGDQKTIDSAEIVPGGSTPKNDDTSTRNTEENGKTPAPSSVGNSNNATGSETMISTTESEDVQTGGVPMEGVEVSSENPKNADPFTKGVEGKGKIPVPSSPNGEGLISPTSSGGEMKEATTANENNQVLNPTGNAFATTAEKDQNNEVEKMDTA